VQPANSLLNSLLKNTPGEGTGPTNTMKSLNNLAGRAPSRGDTNTMKSLNNLAGRAPSRGALEVL
jgi:hypothetical protein